MAQGFGQDIQSSSSRVNQLKRKVKGLVKSDDVMFEIISVFRGLKLFLLLVNIIPSSIHQRLKISNLISSL